MRESAESWRHKIFIHQHIKDSFLFPPPIFKMEGEWRESFEHLTLYGEALGESKAPWGLF